MSWTDFVVDSYTLKKGKIVTNVASQSIHRRVVNADYRAPILRSFSHCILARLPVDPAG
jgi:hypothetical protein